MTTHLVTFSDESMSRARELCVASALRYGVDTHDEWSPNQLALNSPVRLNERGCGYWAWKPLIIQSDMMRLSNNDILIYADSGVEFINNVNYIIDRMGHEKPQDDIWLFGNMYEHAHWCKRDIVDAIWPVIEWRQRKGLEDGAVENSTWERFGKQVQASVIFFRVSDWSRAFVKEWLDWCLFEGGRLIDDSPSRAPNHPEFRENRHDQAILTTLAYREGIFLHYWPASYNDGAFEYPRGDNPDEGIPILFNHHRKRNHEWGTVE